MRIINLYKSSKEEIEASVYCGRNAEYYAKKFPFKRSLEVLANPYKVGEHGQRGECVDLYRKWLNLQVKTKNMYVMAALNSLKEDDTLSCFCVPSRCHCEVIVSAYRYLNEKKDEISRQ